jgi:hypothetical protein
MAFVVFCSSRCAFPHGRSMSTVAELEAARVALFVDRARLHAAAAGVSHAIAVTSKRIRETCAADARAAASRASTSSSSSSSESDEESESGAAITECPSVKVVAVAPPEATDRAVQVVAVAHPEATDRAVQVVAVSSERPVKRAYVRRVPCPPGVCLQCHYRRHGLQGGPSHARDGTCTAAPRG